MISVFVRIIIICNFLRGQFGRNQGARGTYRVAKPRIRSPPRTSGDKKTEDDLMATDDEKLLLRRSLERAKLSNTIIKGKCVPEKADSSCHFCWKQRTVYAYFTEIFSIGGKGIVAAEIQNNKITASMLKSQSDSQKKRLKDVELEVRQSTQVLRDLSINIKLVKGITTIVLVTGERRTMDSWKYFL